LNIINVILDWLHLVATTVWIGGIAFNILVLRPSLSVIEPAKRVKLMGTVLKRFIYVAWLSIGVLVFTGIFLGRGDPDALLSSNYGIALIIKHAIVVVMTVIVALVSFVFFPKLKMFLSEIDVKAHDATKLPSELAILLGKIVALVKLNLTLGVIVLLVTALLGDL